MFRVHRQRSRVATVTAALLSAAALSVVPSGPQASAADVWGPAEDLGVDVDVYNQDREPAIVRVRGDRTAVAAWVAGDDETPGPVTVSRRGAGGGWTAPKAISADLSDRATYDLAVAGSGVASVVWERKVGTTWRIEESHLEGGAWSTPVQVGQGRKPDAIVDGNGVTTVAWSKNGVRVARRAAAGAWSTPRQIAVGSVSGLKLAANPQGDVALSWTVRYRKVRASVRPHGGKSWGAPVTLGKGPYVTSMRVAMDGRGRALALWTVSGIWNEARHDYLNHLAWARSDAQGHWSTTRILTRRLGEDGGWADLSMNGDGRAAVAWLQIDRSDSPAFLWAARFRPDGTWTAPARVSKTRWSEPQVWLDRTGAAHIVTNRTGIWHFSQRPGAAWKARDLGQGQVLDAHGVGNRLVMLFHRNTVRSRTLDVH
ncbi:MAG: hypothetical protein Q7J48_09120 [Nocardioides sp.]|nr:hypothetical protein [Nocardioides sp.]